MIQVKTIKAKFIGYQSPLVVEFDGEQTGTVIIGDDVNQVGERSENWASVFNHAHWQILEIIKDPSPKLK